MKRRESGPRGHRKLGPGLATLGAGFVAVTLSAPAVAGGNRDMTEAKPTPVIAQPSAATGSDDWLARVWSALTSIQLAALPPENEAFDEAVADGDAAAAREFLKNYPGSDLGLELLRLLEPDVAAEVCAGNSSAACVAFTETGAGTPAAPAGPSTEGGGGTGNIPGDYN